MYVTRPLSLYRNFPDARWEQPPPDPCSGYLVVTDEEAEERDYFCWGLCKKKKISKLPLPQDRILKVVHWSEQDDPSETKLWFIPVLDQPLSSNRYYAIRASGKYKGCAVTCSREDVVAGCCFHDVVRDLRPKQFNHRDIYQQFEIRRHYKGGFYAESVAGDGFPPKFLRRRGWELYVSTSLQMREARGLNTRAQMQLPGLNFPAYYKCSPPVVVAKWYCPFVFVKDQLGNVDREEARKSVVYEMTLEQWWEEIYSCENESNGGNTVNVSAVVKRESVLVCGVEAVRGYGDVDDDDGLVWFRVEGHCRLPLRRGAAVGLSSAVVEKMKWVEETRLGAGGGGEEKEVRVQIVEEAASGGAWKKFGCYVLVESFVLRRMDGLVMLSCKFRHVHRTRCKWE